MISRRPSIHLLVVLIVLLPILAVSGALIGISTYTSNQIEQELSSALIRSTAKQIRDSLFSGLSQAERASDLYTHRVAAGSLPPEPTAVWEKLMYESLLVRPAVGSITFAAPDGRAVYVMRVGSEYIVGRAIGRKAGEMSEYEVGPDGNAIASTHRADTYDVIERPWYKQGLAASEPQWTDVYFWFSTNTYYRQSIPGIGFVRQIKQPDGALAGILLVDVTLQSISEILHETEVARVGSVFIVDDDNRVIADSLPRETPGHDEQFKQLSTLKHADAEAAARVVSNGRTDPHSIPINDLGRHVHIEPLKPSASLSWRLIMVLPDENVSGEVNPMQHRAIFISALAVALAIIIGLGLSRILIRPISQLAGHVREIGRGRFEPGVHLKSTREFQQLSDAVNEMTLRLNDEVRLRAEKEAVEQAAEAKSAFFNRVTHDLRTPLNSIIGYTEMLEELKSVRADSVAREDLARVMQASKQLLHLINNLLDLAKAESGGMTLHMQQVDFIELVREVEGIARPLMQRNGNSFTTTIELESLTMQTDPHKLKQILLNLLSNAAKFTQNGRIELRLSCDSANICFCVRDTGVGIPKASIERMFEPYAQASMTAGGTGLGLAICRQLTQLLGGEIELTSDTGVGTTVYLYFPAHSSLRCKPDARPADDPPARAQPAEPMQASPAAERPGRSTE